VFTAEPLGPQHDRTGFSCGNASLDDFIRTKARKENELGYCAVFVLAEAPLSPVIAGYHTLSAHSVALDGIDAASRKKLPRYPIVPTTLIGRLARDTRFRGQGIGALLLMDALKRALHSAGQVGAHAVTVDAIDDAALGFYRRYGFQSLVGHGHRLYLPMAAIARLGL
jgi:ribosomal protein S18 acetylase RimI-like enzyme